MVQVIESPLPVTVAVGGPTLVMLRSADDTFTNAVPLLFSVVGSAVLELTVTVLKYEPGETTCTVSMNEALCPAFSGEI
jgi:hypothetical protein